MTRRQLVVVIGCVTALSGLFTFWHWILSPATTDPGGDVEVADAVVMFVGGRGERLETALDLLDDGVAPALVIPNGLTPEWPAANEICGADDLAFDVFCPVPDPDTTQGEARLIAGLADTEGWDSVIYVTSDYHVARAGHFLDECFDGRIRAVSADSDLGATTWLRRAVREWVGNLVVRTIDRGC